MTGERLEPGRVNAHTHIYSALAPLGMPAPAEAPKNFPEILERVWWRLDRALDPATLHASTRLYVAEALLAGTTTLIDHHESPRFIEGSLDLIAEVCEELGMRAVLCYGATERNGGREEAERGLAECARFLKANRRPLVKGAVGLHASFTVSDDTIRAAGDLCRDLGAVLHVHVAEDAVDVTDARRRGYEGPVERLEALGALVPGSLCAHGIHLSTGQVKRAADAGAWFVQNPRSNHGNGVGYPSSLAVTRHVALGTDGYPARMEEEAAELREEGLKYGDSPEILEARIIAGREVAQRLFRGTFNDSVTLRSGEVRHVVVDGREVVKDGRLMTGDIEEIRQEAWRAAPDLWEMMRSL